MEKFNFESLRPVFYDKDNVSDFEKNNKNLLKIFYIKSKSNKKRVRTASFSKTDGSKKKILEKVKDHLSYQTKDQLLIQENPIDYAEVGKSVVSLYNRLAIGFDLDKELTLEELVNTYPILSLANIITYSNYKGKGFKVKGKCHALFILDRKYSYLASTAYDLIENKLNPLVVRVARQKINYIKDTITKAIKVADKHYGNRTTKNIFNKRYYRVVFRDKPYTLNELYELILTLRLNATYGYKIHTNKNKKKTIKTIIKKSKLNTKPLKERVVSINKEVDYNYVLETEEKIKTLFIDIDKLTHNDLYNLTHMVIWNHKDYFKYYRYNIRNLVYRLNELAETKAKVNNLENSINSIHRSISKKYKDYFDNLEKQTSYTPDSVYIQEASTIKGVQSYQFLSGNVKKMIQKRDRFDVIANFLSNNYDDFIQLFNDNNKVGKRKKEYTDILGNYYNRLNSLLLERNIELKSRAAIIRFIKLIIPLIDKETKQYDLYKLDIYKELDSKINEYVKKLNIHREVLGIKYREKNYTVWSYKLIREDQMEAYKDSPHIIPTINRADENHDYFEVKVYEPKKSLVSNTFEKICKLLKTKDYYRELILYFYEAYNKDIELLLGSISYQIYIIHHSFHLMQWSENFIDKSPAYEYKKYLYLFIKSIKKFINFDENNIPLIDINKHLDKIDEEYLSKVDKVA